MMVLSGTVIVQSIFVVALSCIVLVYISTLSESIAGGDSGEIVAEGCQLGTAHPPGYPLITMLIYSLASATSSEVFSIAYRVNFFCALCTAFAAGCIGQSVLIINQFTATMGSWPDAKQQGLQQQQQYSDNSKSHSGAELAMLSVLPSAGGMIVSMCLFTFSPLIWTYATTAEVFPLNTAFAAMIIYLVISFSRTRSMTSAYLGAFVCGLALCNQHTIILFEAPLILWMLYLLRPSISKQPSVLLILALMFLMGLIPYAYLPIAGYFAPKAGSWGKVDSIGGFLHHFLRRDYGTFQLFSGAQGKQAEGFWVRNEAYINDVITSQGGEPVGCTALLFVVGAVCVVSHAITSSLHAMVGKDTAINGARIVAQKKSSGKAESISSKNKRTKLSSSSILSIPTPPSQALVAPAEGDDETGGPDGKIEIGCHLTPVVLVATLIFYFVVFHSLANLPLADPLLFGVHQRFWMQPNIILFLMAGVGFTCISTLLTSVLCMIFRSIVDQKKGKISNSDKKASNLNSVKGMEVLLRGFCVALSLSIAVFLVYLQYQKWLPLMDMSAHPPHFRNYATAVLAPLPQNSVLFINYDQQWTSVRYRQVCEGFRTDIVTIQLSMATYEWFQTKHQLYPSDIIFPGTYHTYPGSPAHRNDHAFTLQEFLDANLLPGGTSSNNVKGRRQIFLGGQISYSDPALLAKYDMVPVGLVSRFIPKSAGAENVDSIDGTKYMQITLSGWQKVMQALSVTQMPDPVVFTQATWEWTISRDLRDRILDTAACLLEKALEVEASDWRPLVEAVYWMESAYLIEGAPDLVFSNHSRSALTIEGAQAAGDPAASIDATRVPAHLLKNAGLAYLHLVRSSSAPSSSMPNPQQDPFLTIQRGLLLWPLASEKDSQWKLWASARFSFFWGNFLKHPDATKDSQYVTIKNMYAAVAAASKQRG